MNSSELYVIQEITATEDSIHASILLNPDHAIFKGHFPGQPVLPGVCMLDIITEIAGTQRRKVFFIKEAPVVKFLTMIDPTKNPVISLEMNTGFSKDDYSVNGKLFFGQTVFMKCQLLLTERAGH